MGPALAVRDAAREAVVLAVFVRFGFFGLESRSGWTAGSFSLSDKMAISELRLLTPLDGGGRAGLECFAAGGSASRGIEGRGRAASIAGTAGSALVEVGIFGISAEIVASACFARRSPILAFLRLTGMRLIRRSIRDRRSVAWRA